MSLYKELLEVSQTGDFEPLVVFGGTAGVL